MESSYRRRFHAKIVYKPKSRHHVWGTAVEKPPFKSFSPDRKNPLPLNRNITPPASPANRKALAEKAEFIFHCIASLKNIDSFSIPSGFKSSKLVPRADFENTSKWFCRKLFSNVLSIYDAFHPRLENNCIHTRMDVIRSEINIHIRLQKDIEAFFKSGEAAGYFRLLKLHAIRCGESSIIMTFSVSRFAR